MSKEKIIEEANSNLDKAAAAAAGAASASEFTATWAKMIPLFYQVGKGGAPTPAMLQRNVNSLKARNLFVNKTAATMSAGDWGTVLSLANSGITAGDNVFTVRSDVNGLIFTNGQLVMGRTQSNIAGGATYKLSEHWVQEFKTGDKHKAQNTKITIFYTGQADRGNAHFTRYALVDGGTGLAGVAIYANSSPGAYEMYVAVNNEENELMKAEALINTNQIDAGLARVDAIRNAQGAGLTAVSATGLTLTQAREELRRERRIVCAFRGFSFYDARRWGVCEPTSSGGGRTGAVLLSNTSVLSTNGTIEYGYLDYWDVPGNELTYNPASAISTPVVNPKK